MCFILFCSLSFDFFFLFLFTWTLEILISTSADTLGTCSWVMICVVIDWKYAKRKSVSHVMWLMSLFVSKSTKVILFFRCEGRFTRFIQSNFDSKTHFYGGLCLRMSLSWIGYTFKGCVVCTMKIVDSIYLTSLLFSFFFFDRCMHLTLRKLLIGEVILSLCYDAYVLSMLVNNWWTREKKTIAPSHIQMMRMKLKEKNVFAAIV